MKHDEKCAYAPNDPTIVGKAITGGGPCGCADRAIAAARRQGRIEGYTFGYAVGPDVDPVLVREYAEKMCEARWPEDKP